MRHAHNIFSIVADVGGTNTRVALSRGTKVLPDTVRRYTNTRFAGMAEVLQQYIKDEDGVDPIAVCIAVAGPVRDGAATLTNLDWTITNDILAKATRAENVCIINDLQAQGHAIGHLEDARLRPILTGKPEAGNSTKLVIGVGTGFNAAPVFDTAAGRIVAASESGHVNLPVQTPADEALRDFVARAHGFGSVEDVLSGRGLENVYAFCAQPHGARSITAQEIMAAREANDPIAIETIAIFVRMLGMSCGNLALTQLPFGGIYLVGGVARAMSPYLIDMGFGSNFRDKGRFSDFMDSFAVTVVEDDFAALTGCAAYLKETFDL